MAGTNEPVLNGLVNFSERRQRNFRIDRRHLAELRQVLAKVLAPIALQIGAHGFQEQQPLVFGLQLSGQLVQLLVDRSFATVFAGLASRKDTINLT